MKVLAVRAFGEHTARTWWNFDICDAAQEEFQIAYLHGWLDGTSSAAVILQSSFLPYFHYMVQLVLNCISDFEDQLYLQ